MKATIAILIALFAINANSQTINEITHETTFLNSETNVIESLDNSPDAPPYFGYVFGPRRTVRWLDYGTNRVPKILSESAIIYVEGRLVNEIILRAIDNRVNVQSVIVTLIDGQRFELRNVTGILRQNRTFRSEINRYNSLRIEQIEIQATSPNLIGSRGELQITLGLAE